MLKFTLLVKQGLQHFYSYEELQEKGDKLLNNENAAQLKTMWSKVVEKTNTMWHLGEISYYFISFFALYVLGLPVFCGQCTKKLEN